MNRVYACARTDPTRVAKVLAAGGGVQYPMEEGACPACQNPWNASHLLVLYDADDHRPRFEIFWSEDLAAHNLIEDGVGICWSKSLRQMQRIRDALTTPAAWFVSYYNHSLRDERTVYLPNQRIVRQHPLVWFASCLAGGSSMVLVSWHPLTAAELAANTQVIVED